MKPERIAELSISWLFAGLFTFIGGVIMFAAFALLGVHSVPLWREIIGITLVALGVEIAGKSFFHALRVTFNP